MQCQKCGHEFQIGDFPFCTKDGDHVPGNFSVIGDDIPGGIEIRHGICHSDGTPKRYYSKTDIRKAAEAAGLQSHVEHVSPEGSDKSEHTVRWI